MKESQRRARLNRHLDELKECCETMGDADDGLQYDRWAYDTPHGKYVVSVTGWRMRATAVVDDFGNLIELGEWLTL